MNSNRNYLLIFCSLIFMLMSATAVNLFSFRLADISLFLLLVVMTVTCKEFFVRGPIFYLVILMLYVCSRSVASLLSGSPFNEDAIFVPVAIFTAILYSLSIISNSTLLLLQHFSKLFVYCSIIFFLLWIMGIDLPFVNYEFDFNRFSFLSNNPNQFGLYLVAPLALAISAIVDKGWFGFRQIYFFAVVIVLMIASVSKTLILLTILYFILSALYSLIYKGKRRAGSFSFSKLTVLLFSIYFLLYVSILAYSGTTLPGSQTGQGDTRIRLWTNGIEAWSDAFFLGNGPGHFSGYSSPYDGYEAHNFYIDFAASYGAVGLLLFAFFVCSVLSRVLKSRNAYAFALMFLNLFLSAFHFYGRQPIFWIILVAAYSLSKIKNNQLEYKCAD